MPMPSAGFFGKLPSAGDFVQRRLPASFVDAWDRHFEGAVAASREALGERWHEVWQASPAWRFLLAPGACGDSAWIGVTGPARDRVGRCFPMVIAAAVAVDSLPEARGWLDHDAWFEAAERLHGMAQADATIDVDGFDERVAALSDPQVVTFLPDDIPGSGVGRRAALPWRLPLPLRPDTAHLAELWHRLAVTPGRWCLWWSVGTSRMPASILVSDGLPPAEAHVEFLARGHGGQLPPMSPRQVLPAVPASHDDDLTQPSRPAGAVPPSWSSAGAESSGHAEVSSSLSGGSGGTAVGAPAAMQGAPVVVLRFPDVGVTLVAASAARPDPRQRVVAAVTEVAGGMSVTEWQVGMPVLRSRLLALNPPLLRAAEDLLDPLVEDCSVIALRVAAGRAELLGIGAVAAWHWRRGQLRPVFTAATTSAPSGQVDDDPFGDLLSGGMPPRPGLGAAEHPLCEQAGCAVQPGDRLLLLTTPWVQLAPEVLVRSLSMSSCDDARRHLATAAGIGPEPARWPIAIIEVDA